MRICLVLLAGLSLTTDALAQSKPVPVAPAAGQPSARQMALSRRYVELAQGEQLEDAIHNLIMAQAASDPGTRALPDEERRFLVDLSTELTADLLPQMMDSLVPVYARGYTEEELQALVGFYETDVGRSIIEKTFEMMPETNAAMMAVLPQMMDKMAVRICARYGCEPDELRGAMDRDGAEPESGAPAKRSTSK